MTGLTMAQRRVLQHVADNGPLTSANADWPRSVLPRREVRTKLWFDGLISTPNMNKATHGRWEITEAGRLALSKVGGGTSCTNLGSEGPDGPFASDSACQSEGSE